MEGMVVGKLGILGKDGMVGIEGMGGKANLGTEGIVGNEGLAVGVFGIEGMGGIFGTVGMVGMVGRGVAWRRRRFVAAEHIAPLSTATRATIRVEKKRVEEAMASLRRSL
ncbi:hypothetical protein CRG98_031960 [Punica granatum]|uniref:Uncharacterized protein n=1 Tax=Punica granatum TaxID=22663 RepID=A0A2I0IUK4_PUNGR|nr:hypothetical protein CRG98_031960 [Punica granatum]